MLETRIITAFCLNRPQRRRRTTGGSKAPVRRVVSIFFPVDLDRAVRTSTITVGSGCYVRTRCYAYLSVSRGLLNVRATLRVRN